MRAGSKYTRTKSTVWVRLSGRALLLASSVVAANALVVLGCDSKRLCDDGACEQPSDAPHDSGVDASVVNATSDVESAPHEAGDAMAAEAGEAVPTRPCEGDGGCPSGGVCHPDVNVCVACTSSDQCEAPTPLCAVRQNPANNLCVGCLSHDDCSDGLCVDQHCVACDVASNAGCQEPATQCVHELDAAPRCVACAVDDDCSDPTKPVCELLSGSCMTCSLDGVGCVGGERCVELASGENPDAGSVLARRCIECTAATAASDCRADAPYCVNDHCAVCDPVLGQGCDGASPYCRDGAELAAESDVETSDQPAAVCAECRDDADCVVDDAICFAGECVECGQDSDCTDPTASSCDVATHECVPCSVGAECKHIEGAHVCHVEEQTDASSPSAGCVECDALDYRACDGAKDVCVTIPATGQFTCSDHQVNQVGFCGECLADADCSADERCVVQASVASGKSGYYCVYLVGSKGAPSSCSETSAEPFTRALHATSIDGVTGTYCALDTTTCEVFNHFKQSCADDTDCGAPEDGATCYPADAVGRCTYTCTADADCPQPNGDCVNGRCYL